MALPPAGSFEDLERRPIYFQESGEQALTWDLRNRDNRKKTIREAKGTGKKSLFFSNRNERISKIHTCSQSSKNSPTHMTLIQEIVMVFLISERRTTMTNY